MPIHYDIMDHEIIGPAIRKGREEGLREGKAEGRVDGERELLLRLLTRRFERVPEWALKRIEALGAAEVEETAMNVLTAASLEELLGR